VGAVPLFFDHLRDPSDLPLDPAEPLEVPRLGVGIDRHGFPAFLAGGAAARNGDLLGRGHRTTSAGRSTGARGGREWTRPAGRHPRSRSEFESTLTEESAIAALAITGLSWIPKNG